MRKPVAVTGVLLMDQRFWGMVCNEKKVGPPPVHIEPFKGIAVDWADKALDPTSTYAEAAAALTLTFGDESNDGVSQNVQAFKLIADSGFSPPQSSLVAQVGDEESEMRIPRTAG